MESILTSGSHNVLQQDNKFKCTVLFTWCLIKWELLLQMPGKWLDRASISLSLRASKSRENDERGLGKQENRKNGDANRSWALHTRGTFLDSGYVWATYSIFIFHLCSCVGVGVCALKYVNINHTNKRILVCFCLTSPACIKWYLSSMRMRYNLSTTTMYYIMCCGNHREGLSPCFVQRSYNEQNKEYFPKREVRQTSVNYTKISLPVTGGAGNDRQTCTCYSSVKLRRQVRPASHIYNDTTPLPFTDNGGCRGNGGI